MAIIWSNTIGLSISFICINRSVSNSGIRAFPDLTSIHTLELEFILWVCEVLQCLQKQIRKRDDQEHNSITLLFQGHLWQFVSTRNTLQRLQRTDKWIRYYVRVFSNSCLKGRVAQRYLLHEHTFCGWLQEHVQQRHWRDPRPCFQRHKDT